MTVGIMILTFFTGAVVGLGTMCLVQARNMTTKLQIISRLWSHITDLRLILRGTSSKTLEEIENEIDITENLCRPYADADDEEAFK
ncbi:hypothetical protein DW074_08515 [Ruminococcus sp. AF46-10NS]|nr:hypothetical protein [Ruminococcus sp. AF46-10NS]RHK23789.1 hypothetical protein DW074_08515 [Ruminococcus sp. AF46-10NS]DAY74985.1 MAG TPA: Protein of unknown function (DUF3789) [Caudoviricetes sp.]